MMLGSEAQKHDVLAQECFYGLMTRHDMRISEQIVGVRSTEQFVWHHLALTSYL